MFFYLSCNEKKNLRFEIFYQKICSLSTDCIISGKNISELIMFWFSKRKTMVILRVRKSIINIIVYVCRANLLIRLADIQEEDIGIITEVLVDNLLDNKKYIDLYGNATKLIITILLIAQHKENVEEFDSLLTNAKTFILRIIFIPFILPGAGATDLYYLNSGYEDFTTYDNDLFILKKLFDSLSFIPYYILLNSGCDGIMTFSELKSRSTLSNDLFLGVDTFTGVIKSMIFEGPMDSYKVRATAITTSTETSRLLLRLDGVFAYKKDTCK